MGTGIDAYTKICLHGNATPFVDACAVPKSITNVGPVARDGVNKVFGAGSMQFNFSNSYYLRTGFHADWNYAGLDFTLDTWIRMSSMPTEFLNGYIYQMIEGSNTLYWLMEYNGGNYSLTFRSSRPNPYYLFCLCRFYWTPTLNTWYHIEVARYGTDMLLFIDGDLKTWNEYTPPGAVEMPTFTTANLDFGKGLGGRLDELRVSKGIARHTANFTPMAEEYAIEPNTYYADLAPSVRLGATFTQDSMMEVMVEGAGMSASIEPGGVFQVDLEEAAALNDSIEGRIINQYSEELTEAAVLDDAWDAQILVIGNFNDSVPYQGVPRWTCKGYGGATLNQETAKFTLSASGSVGSAGHLSEYLKTDIRASGFAGIFGIGSNRMKCRINADGSPVNVGSLSQSMTTTLAGEGTTDYNFGILQYVRGQ